MSSAIARPATAATPNAGSAAVFTADGLGQAAGDEPDRADPHVVGAPHPVAVVVGVVDAHLQRQAHDERERPRATRRRRRLADRRSRADRYGNDRCGQRSGAGSGDPTVHECAMMGRMTELWQLGATA